jgi:UV DNA damage endonuclease
MAVNDLVAGHLAWSDFEVEAKLKNLAFEGWPSTSERAGALAE